MILFLPFCKLFDLRYKNILKIPPLKLYNFMS